MITSKVRVFLFFKCLLQCLTWKKNITDFSPQWSIRAFTRLYFSTPPKFLFTFSLITGILFPAFGQKPQTTPFTSRTDPSLWGSVCHSHKPRGQFVKIFFPSNAVPPASFSGSPPLSRNVVQPLLLCHLNCTIIIFLSFFWSMQGVGFIEDWSWHWSLPWSLPSDPFQRLIFPPGSVNTMCSLSEACGEMTKTQHSLLQLPVELLGTRGLSPPHSCKHMLMLSFSVFPHRALKIRPEMPLKLMKMKGPLLLAQW